MADISGLTGSGRRERVQFIPELAAQLDTVLDRIEQLVEGQSEGGLFKVTSFVAADEILSYPYTPVSGAHVEAEGDVQLPSGDTPGVDCVQISANVDLIVRAPEGQVFPAAVLSSDEDGSTFTMDAGSVLMFYLASGTKWRALG